jgi:phage terminase large subunit-like protein
MFAALEDQMVTWEPESGDESPDRIDALVWAARRLFLGKKGPVVAGAPVALEMAANGE